MWDDLIAVCVEPPGATRKLLDAIGRGDARGADPRRVVERLPAGAVVAGARAALAEVLGARRVEAEAWRRRREEMEGIARRALREREEVGRRAYDPAKVSFAS
jgi:hypothetical protein